MQKFYAKYYAKIMQQSGKNHAEILQNIMQKSCKKIQIFGKNDAEIWVNEAKK